MQTLYPGIGTYNDHSLRSQKFKLLQNSPKIESTTSQMVLYLSEFDVKLIHMPGTKMIQSDALSRRPDHGEENKQDNEDLIMLPEGLFLNLLDHEFDDEQTFENNDEQSDPIKTLSVHGLKSLHNHFSKVTAATSVNDIITEMITVNVMDMDLQRWIAMAHDMDITVDDTMNI